MTTNPPSYQPIPLPDHIALDDEEAFKRACEFRQIMQARHTVRDFCDRPVPRQIITEAIRTAGLAPSGANHQPWHFAAIADPDIKRRIRLAAEAEEEKFYGGAAGDEWLAALEPIGTGFSKPHLQIAPWLIVIFAQRFGLHSDGKRFKHYYVNESIGIATGFLIAALHQAGLSMLTHTPNPMGFLNEVLDRPPQEKPVMILAVGHPEPDAKIPAAAKQKKSFDNIAGIWE